jgi:hypothetical protein
MRTIPVPPVFNDGASRDDAYVAAFCPHSDGFRAPTINFVAGRTFL